VTSIPLTPALFEGAISFEQGDGWLRPWRLHVEKLPLYYNVAERAIAPAGVRLRFRTASPTIELGVVPSDVARRFDLTVEGELVQTVELAPGGGAVAFAELPAGERTVELWLPHGVEVSLTDLRLADGAAAEVVPDPRPRWVTYGSSISHCGAAHSPARTWPATAARLRGLNLTCLGYGGNCHLEPMVALMIRDLPADVITLKVGINIHGGSLSPRTFRPALVGFVQIIRERHPDTPIGVISPIISPPRETTPGATGLTLQKMRAELEEAVGRLAACGDRNIRYVSGLTLFDADLVERYLPDLLHPNGDGYEIIGRRVAQNVLPELLP
jgi:hypothetical protein